jgi:pimeloyl-ACP methyl ester carboxylesterase
MKDIPTWVFHGDRDELVPFTRSTEMVNAIKKCGGSPKYSILKGQPHDIHRTYGNTDLYTWMLRQSKDIPFDREPEIVDREVEPQLIKPKQPILKKIFKKNGKAKEENYEEGEKVRVEFN